MATMTLDELVSQLRAAYGTELHAGVLYGSAAAGEHIPKRSDDHVLVLANGLLQQGAQQVLVVGGEPGDEAGEHTGPVVFFVQFGVHASGGQGGVVLHSRAVGVGTAESGAAHGALVVQASQDGGHRGAGELDTEILLYLGRGQRVIGGPQGGEHGGLKLARRAANGVGHGEHSPP